MNSLNKRLLWVSLLVLVGFLGAAGLAVERAFQNSLQQARQERLQAHLYSLLAAAELEPQGLTISASHPNERLYTPGSGLYAQILNADGNRVWQSHSLLGVEADFDKELPPGSSEFFFPAGDLPLFGYAYGVAWQEPNKPERQFTLVIAEEQGAFREQLDAFRADLWSALVLVTLLLLLALALIVRWGLAPLRAVERDIAEIEAGRAELLTGRYPQELQGLTNNLNRLIQNERSRMTHYRHTLANLAHSLKTPLAVLRNGLDEHSQAELAEQVERMDNLVKYQLQRAATTGQRTFATPIAVCPLVEKLLASLDKVYWQKQIIAELECDPRLRLRAEEGDLMELFGNLLDNAYKWCDQRIDISLTSTSNPSGAPQVQISINDDGPGIAEAEVARVQKRGERGDVQTPGQGIGLAVVVDIVNAYGGEMSIARSALGGASVQIDLPR